LDILKETGFATAGIDRGAGNWQNMEEQDSQTIVNSVERDVRFTIADNG
jgi:hypothetical protein